MANASRYLSWPFHIGPQGGVAFTEDPGRSAAQRITQLIFTQLGERVMVPSYGTSTQDYLFEINDEVVAAELGLRIQSAINEWEPDINVTYVRPVSTGDWETGELVIEVSYTVTPTNTEFTTVVRMGGSIGEIQSV